MRAAAALRSCSGALMVAAVFMLAVAPAAAADLLVFAAASLKEGLDAAGAQFQQTSGQRMVASYASSSVLAKQIENGAPADVFISADLDWMDYAEKRNLLNAGSRFNLLRNRLVLIAAADSKLQVRIEPGFALAKLLGDGRLAMADPDSVPAGKYGKAALEKLGVWASVESKIARGDNVRTALNFVARGEAPLGIVYQTDAYAEKKVRTVAQFPRETHPAIIYPVAVVASSKHPSVPAFVAFLKGSDARAIFEKYGFSMDR